jgi:hypothetical protein
LTMQQKFKQTNQGGEAETEQQGCQGRYLPDKSRNYTDGFTRSPTQHRLGQKRTNATIVLRYHFYCVGNIENVEAALVRLLISPTY